jgi:uncharacterized DUF497 family protein
MDLPSYWTMVATFATAFSVLRCTTLEYTKAVREIHWTERAEAHIMRHNVTPDEVEQVINTRPRLTMNGRDDTTFVLGTTSAGRYLAVVLAAADDGRQYVVTSRDMTSNERRVFRRKGR